MLLENQFPPIDERPYKEAKTLIRNGHEVTLFCIRCDGQKEEEEFEGIRIKRINLMKLPHFTFLGFAMPVILKMLKKEQFNVFHIHNPPDSLVLPALYQKGRGKAKIVLDIHDPVIPGMLQHPEQYKHRTFWSASIWEKVALRSANKIIVVSTGSKERLLSFNIPPQKITIIRNYVDLETFSKGNTNPEKIKMNYGLNDKRIILYAGTISPIRGIDILIKAFARVKDSYRDLMLVIIGNKDSYWEELKKLAVKEGAENLLMLPWQPYESMPDFIAAADICVLPRRYSYHTAITGNSNTLFQYMAMRKPIVATNLLSINSFVDDSCAVLVEPDSVTSMANGLRRVLSDPVFGRKISEKAYRSAIDRYTWRTEEDKLLALYNVL